MTGTRNRLLAGTGRQPEHWPADRDQSLEELARQQGVEPIESLDDLAQPNLFESDEEYEAFLADLYASRRSDVAWASSSTPTSLPHSSRVARLPA